jgi:hypothetical protein
LREPSEAVERRMFSFTDLMRKEKDMVWVFE